MVLAGNVLGGRKGPYTEGARAYSTTEQTIPNTTQASIALPLEVYDTDGIHDLITLNSRMICRTAGLYLIVACLRLYANATGLRAVYIVLNGTTDIWSSIELNPTADGPPIINQAVIYPLVVNDYVELRTWQNSGGNLNTRIGTGYAPSLTIQRVG